MKPAPGKSFRRLVGSARDIGLVRAGVAGRSSSHPVTAACIAVNYRRVLRAVRATVDPLAAALVVTSEASVRITLFTDVSILAEHEYREPSLDQNDRSRWFGHDVDNRDNSKVMLDVPSTLADLTRIGVYGAIVMANRLFGIDPASTLDPGAPPDAVIVREYKPQPQPR